MESTIKKSTSIAIFNSHGQILMGLRKDSCKWTLPGGGLNEGELPIDGAKRELHEEAGFQISHLKLIGETTILTKDGPMMIYSYKGQSDAVHTPKLDPDDECAYWEWVPVEDIKHFPLHHFKNVTLHILGLEPKDLMKNHQKDLHIDYLNEQDEKYKEANEPTLHPLTKMYGPGFFTKNTTTYINHNSNTLNEFSYTRSDSNVKLPLPLLFNKEITNNKCALTFADHPLTIEVNHEGKLDIVAGVNKLQEVKSKAQYIIANVVYPYFTDRKYGLIAYKEGGYKSSNLLKKIGVWSVIFAMFLPFSSQESSNFDTFKDQHLKSSSVQPQYTYVPFGKHAQDKFLDAIQQIESSGGLNTNHKLITYGMHEGQRAIGRFGLMPKTIVWLVNRGKHPAIKAMKGIPDTHVTSYLEDKPQLRLQLAREYASFLYYKFNGNKEKMAYAWLYGHNLDITDEMIASNYYVERFNRWYKG